MTKVAVERGLRPYHDALKNAGFVVVELNSPDQIRAEDTHAVVLSGTDNDFMGIDAGSLKPVITAAGRTPLEVVSEVRRSLGPRE